VAQKNINLKTLSDLQVIIPPMDLQQQFVSFFQQSDKSKFELEQALAELTATYKRIIAENLG
jgi:type I restriction enzyme S subunit